MDVKFFEELRELMLKYKVISIISPLDVESGIEMTCDGKMFYTGFTVKTDIENNYFIEGVK